MSGELTPEDADGLRDLAERSRRASGTARRTAAATGDSELRQKLSGLGSQLQQAALLADQIAYRIETGGHLT